MSLFSNDMRVATTATPSFAKEANVGQFGWTGADTGHYNQLIQYVDECRKIWVSLEEKITYVESLIKQVEGIDEQVQYVKLVSANVTKLAGETKVFRDQTESMYLEVKPLIENFEIEYADFSKKYDQVVVMHSEAGQAAISASVSETSAKNSADRAQELVDELQKGQVYRGKWNPHSQAWPDNKGTNSVWDVVLNEGEIEYTWNGTRWFWGDRVIYIKDSNEYQQLESGGSVVSVNGKTGAVTLTNEEVGAAPFGFGLGEKQAFTVTDMDSDPFTWNDGRIGWVRGISTTLNKPEDRNGVAMIQRYQSTGTTSGIFITYLAGSDTYSRYWTGTAWRDWVKVYHSGNKPTPSELGAVNKAGDTITGNTFVDRGASAEPQLGVSRDGRKILLTDNGTHVGIYSSGITGKDPSWLAQRSIGDGGVTLGDNRSSTNINGKDTTFTYKGKKVYTEDFKPDALPSHGFGMGNKQGGAILAENFTEDKTRDFNKLLTAGEYTVSGEWMNGATNDPGLVGHTGIVKVEVRNFGAGPSYIQTFTSVTNGLPNRAVRTGTGTAPNSINWGFWSRGGLYEQELGHRLTVNRTNSTGPAYVTLTKREKRTDLTTGWYNFASLEMKQGDGVYDPNNPNSGQLAASINGARQWDNKKNRLVINLRGAIDGNTKSEVVLYEDSVNLICNGKATRYNGVDFTIDNKKVYHEGLKPTAADVGALPLSGGEMSGPIVVAGIKGAIKVDNQKSISFQDQGGTMFHNMASGNNLRWQSGTGGERFLMELNSGGALTTDGPQYSTTAQVVQSSAKSTWIALEAPEGANPYISVKTPSMSGPAILMGFDGTADFKTPLKSVGVTSSDTLRVNSYYPMMELHSPSVVSFATFAEPSNSTYRVGASNGSGSVSKVLSSMDLAGTITFTGNVYSGQGNGYLDTTGMVGGSIFGGDIATWCRASFAPISDSRLKRNIKPSTKSALEDVSKIKFHSYEWEMEGFTKDFKGTEVGILAQEMENINPSYTKDIETYNEDGTVKDSVKSLDVTNMLALALKANQELLARIEALEAKLQ